VRKDPTWRKYQLLADWVWREKFSISTAMTAQKDRRMIFSALALDHDAARRHVWGFFGAHSQAARDDAADAPSPGIPEGGRGRGPGGAV
jgi:hypothetical protein